MVWLQADAIDGDSALGDASESMTDASRHCPWCNLHGATGLPPAPTLTPLLAPVAAVPQAHIDFIDSRPVWLQRGEVVFVHAGIRPGVAMRDQRETDLVWIRDGWLDDTRDHGFLVVHGHTAIEEATLYPNRLNIDSSAAYGGPLSAVVIEGRDVWLLTPEGRVALAPQAIPEQSLR